MPIVLLGIIWETQDGKQDDTLDEEYKRIYLVKASGADTGTATAIDILQCPGLPAQYERFTNVPGDFGFTALVNMKSCRKREATPFLWEVTVEYTTKGVDEFFQHIDPLQRKPVYEYDTQQGMRAAEFDDNGRAMVNSAELPFDPPAEQPESTLRMTVTRNEGFYDEAKALEFTDSVNSLAWHSGLSGTWICRGIKKGPDGFNRATPFSKVIYQFEFKRPKNGYAWVDVLTGLTRILDQGRAERINGNPKVILDLQSHPISQNVCLDGYGLRLNKGPDRGSKVRTAYTAGVTSLEVTNKAALNFVKGKVLYVESEQMLVTAVDIVTDTLTVQGAWNGTVAANHALGADVYQKSGCVTSLVAAITAIASPITVYDQQVFGPMTAIGGTVVKRDDFIIRIDDEEMIVSNAMNNQLTVTRAWNGTTAAAHDINSVVQQAPVFLYRKLLKDKDFNLLGL